MRIGHDPVENETAMLLNGTSGCHYSGHFSLLKKIQIMDTGLGPVDYGDKVYIILTIVPW
jgi:hypothetical protein